MLCGGENPREEGEREGGGLSHDSRPRDSPPQPRKQPAAGAGRLFQRGLGPKSFSTPAQGQPGAVNRAGCCPC